MNNIIHPTAIIDSTAKIGNNVIVDPFAVIEENTEIGDGTRIHSHANIRSGSRIGQNCQIHCGAVIAGIPQDLKYEGEESTVIIGNNTSIREYVTINRGTKSKGTTIIGNDCLIMAYSHVAHDCVLRDHVIIGNATQIAGEVFIDDYAILSGGVLVHQFTRLSKHIMVQGGSRVNKDIPPYAMVGRDPISFCGINIVGLKRRNFTNDQIFAISDCYRTLYNKGLNISDALALIDKELEHSNAVKFISDFVKTSERGIVRGVVD